MRLLIAGTGAMACLFAARLSMNLKLRLGRNHFQVRSIRLKWKMSNGETSK